MNKGTALVTGGLGFIGSALVGALLSDGYEVHVVDLRSVHRREIPIFSSTYHACDVTEAKAIREVMRTVCPTVVFHLAATSYIPDCDANPVETERTNVIGTLNVLAASPPGTTFVLASSAAVYAPELGALHEDASPVGPIECYGISKFHCEDYISYFHNAGKINGIIARIFNPVGAGDETPHLVPTIVKQVADGVMKVRVGNIEVRRDYIHVEDTARGLIGLSEVRDGQRQPLVCNIGTGVTRSVVDMLEILSQVSGIALTYLVDANSVRTVDRPNLCADVTRLKQLLDWVPSTDIAPAVKAAWDSHTISTP